MYAGRVRKKQHESERARAREGGGETEGAEREGAGGGAGQRCRARAAEGWVGARALSRTTGMRVTGEGAGRMARCDGEGKKGSRRQRVVRVTPRPCAAETVDMPHMPHMPLDVPRRAPPAGPPRSSRPPVLFRSEPGAAARPSVPSRLAERSSDVSARSEPARSTSASSAAALEQLCTELWDEARASRALDAPLAALFVGVRAVDASPPTAAELAVSGRWRGEVLAGMATATATTSKEAEARATVVSALFAAIKCRRLLSAYAELLRADQQEPSPPAAADAAAQGVRKAAEALLASAGGDDGRPLVRQLRLFVLKTLERAQGVGFGVGFAGTLMPAFADNLPVTHNHATHARVGMGCVQALARQFQGAGHVMSVEHRLFCRRWVHSFTGSRARRSISSRNSLRSWKRRYTEAKRM